MAGEGVGGAPAKRHFSVTLTRVVGYEESTSIEVEADDETAAMAIAKAMDEDGEVDGWIGDASSKTTSEPTMHATEFTPVD